MQELYKYQQQGVEWLSNNQNCNLILGDDMGLGKTAQLITASQKVGARRVLVLCPASIKINWAREFYKWSDLKEVFVVTGGKDRIPLVARVVICNYDLVIKDKIKKQLLQFKFDVGIMDECHYLQSTDSKRTKAVLARGGIIWACKYKWASTGTFMPNRPKNMYPLLRALRPDVIAPYLDYVDYAYHFCNGHQGAFGFNDNGCSNAEELGERLKKCMIRRLKSEVLPELPDKTIQYIYLEHTPEIQRVLDLEAELSEDERNAILEFQALGSQARIRNELAKAKIKQCVKFIKEQLTTLDKVVIGFWHREVLNVLKEELKSHGVCVVAGGMTGAQKQAEVDEFVNNPSKHVFLGQIQAAGVGIDGLQLVCSNMIFVETSWVPGDIDQYIDRLRRIGQKNNIHVQILTVPNSIEEDIIASELNKRKNIEKVMSKVESDFSSEKQITKGETMTLESEVSRVADALEALVGVLGDSPLMKSIVQDAEATRAYANALAKDEVKEAPVEADHEKERLVAEAKALGIPGKVGAMAVSTLKKKIEEAKNAAAEPVAEPVAESVEQPAIATPAEVQKVAQELVKKIGTENAASYMQGLIHQVGGEIDDGTGAVRPAKLADLTPAQMYVVLEATNAKLGE